MRIFLRIFMEFMQIFDLHGFCCHSTRIVCEFWANFTVLINVVSRYSVFFRNQKQCNPNIVSSTNRLSMLVFLLWRFSNFFQHLDSLRQSIYSLVLHDATFDLVSLLPWKYAYWLSSLLYLPPSQRPSNACFAVTEVLEWSTKSYWYRI